MPRKSASCLTAPEPSATLRLPFRDSRASGPPSGGPARSLPANDGPEAGECQTLELLATGEGDYRLHDPDALRAWMRDRKRRDFVDKTTTAAEAVRCLVADGDYVSFDFSSFTRGPLVLIFERLAPPSGPRARDPARRDRSRACHHREDGEELMSGVGAEPARPTARASLDPALDTFPKLLLRNVERFPDKVAIREKDYGIWQSYTWRQYLEQSRLIALGLAALGFARGDKTAIVGDNRPQLYWAMLATQALGGVPVPLYQDSIEKEMEYIVDHAEVRFAVVEDQEQVDKLLQVKARCPRLEYIVYDDARGLRHYKDEGLISLAAVQELGRRFDGEHRGYFEQDGGQGVGGRRRDHLLHVGHHRSAEGDDAVPPEPDRDRPERHRVRGPAGDRRGRGLSPDGVDRRPHVLVRAVDPDRVHHQLPGELGDGAAGSPGDRPDVLLRPAGHLPAHPDLGDDPDRGRGVAQAPTGPVLPGRGPAGGAMPADREARVAR